MTSSGNADGFETYDFDVFTDTVAVAGIFTSNGQSISISEVSQIWIVFNVVERELLFGDMDIHSR